MSETTTQASPVTDPLVAAIEKRRSEWPKETAALNGRNANLPAKVTDKAVPVVDAPVSTASEAVKDTPAEKPAPEPAPTVDLTWLPEKLRPKAGSLDPELVEYLKPNVLRQSDYTKKTQKIAEREKEIDGLTKRAGLWDKLEAHPEVAEVARRMIAGETLSDIALAVGEQTDGFHYHGAEDPQIDKRVESVAERKAREVIDAEKAAIRAARDRQAALGSAVREYATENSLDRETIDAAGALVDAQVAEWSGFEITPENVVSLLKPHVAAVLAKRGSGNKDVAKAEASGLSKVASPIGQGASGVRSPASLPAYLADKPRGQWTDADRARYMEYLAAARRGPT